MKYRIIPKEYIKVCVDRLTRFKPPRERYERVFFDILNKFLISDAGFGFNKNCLDIDTICNMAVEIFNTSIPFEYDSYLSDTLFLEEKRIFNLNDNDIKYLKSGLNLTGAIKYLINENNLPLNLEYLKYKILNEDAEFSYLRDKYSLLYPVNKIILTEGATEEILLPKFAAKLGYDFNKEGVFVLGAGGKNQVARKYYKMVDEIKLPIFILLDYDADETRELILTKLRAQDKIYLIKGGEFEDILPLDLIIKSINGNFSNNLHCAEDDFDLNLKMTKNLHNLFKNKGFGEYKKAEFAKMVMNYLESFKGVDFAPKLSGEIEKIIDEIRLI